MTASMEHTLSHMSHSLPTCEIKWLDLRKCYKRNTFTGGRTDGRTTSYLDYPVWVNYITYISPCKQAEISHFLDLCIGKAQRFHQDIAMFFALVKGGGNILPVAYEGKVIIRYFPCIFRSHVMLYTNILRVLVHCMRDSSDFHHGILWVCPLWSYRPREWWCKTLA